VYRNVNVYRHIAASRLHEFTMQEVVLDSEELEHLKICSDCEALLRRFSEHRVHHLQKKFDKPDRRKN
jgi:hypothetical protein